MMNRQSDNSLLVVATLFVLSACGTQQPTTSRLDSSGLTVVTLDDMIVLARPIPQLTASARDYAYISPIEINRMGDRHHYLWIGLASTVDRGLSDASLAAADTFALLVDGQPMTLPLSDWNTTLDQSPYETPLPLYATLHARASLDQIKRIASAQIVEAHFITDAGSTLRYRMWHGAWPTWSLLSQAK